MAPAVVEDQNVPPPTLETSLGVVGSLRVRSYGNVKHAHLILKKVDEEEFEDSSGRKRKRGVFSLFAQKLINVKAGKELFLYLQPANGDVQERCVALEGELFSADDLSGTETTMKDTPTPADKMDVDTKGGVKVGNKASEKVEKGATAEKLEVKPAESAMSIDTKLEEPATAPPREQVLPPKMRKLWSRKSIPNSSLPMNDRSITSPAKPPPTSRTLVSTAVQATPSTSDCSVQASPSSCSASAQTMARQLVHTPSQTPSPAPAARIDADAQTDVSKAPPVSASQRPSNPGFKQTRGNDETSKSVPSASTTPDSANNNTSRRSLSPMDMDSPSASTPLTLLSTPSPPPISQPGSSQSSQVLNKSVPTSKPIADAIVNLRDIHKQPSIPTAPKAMKMVSANVHLNRPLPTAPSAPRALLQFKGSALGGPSLPHNPPPPLPPPPPLQTPPPPPPDVSSVKISIPIPRVPPPPSSSKANGISLDEPSSSRPNSPRGVFSFSTPTSSKTTLEQIPPLSSSSQSANALPTPVSVTDTHRPSIAQGVGSWSRISAPTFVPATSLSHPPLTSSCDNSRKRPLSPVTPLDDRSSSSDSQSSQPNKKWKKIENGDSASSAKEAGSVSVKAEPTTPAFASPAAAGWGSGLTIENASVDQLITLVNGALATVKMLTSSTSTPQIPPPTPPPVTAMTRASSVQSEEMEIESVFSEPLQRSHSPPRARSPSYSPSSSVMQAYSHPDSAPREISALHNPTNTSFEPMRAIKIEPVDTPLSLSTPIPIPTSFALPPTQPLSPEITILPPLHLTTGVPMQPISHALPPKPAPSSFPVSAPRTTATSMASPISRRFNIPRQYSAQLKIRGDPGIRGIVFSQSGTEFAVLCRDNTIRIWDNVSRSEIAKLAHSSSVIAVAWLEDDSGVVSLGSNGVVSKWTKKGPNNWNWEKLLDAGDYDPADLAYRYDCIAVANPRRGIKIWTLMNGQWKPVDRSVPRKDVITIQFVENGAGLLCGATDGTVFHCSVPKCKIVPIATLKTKVFYVDVTKDGTAALVVQASGRAHIIDINTAGGREPGQTLQQFSLRDADRSVTGGRQQHAFGAIFAANDTLVVFGSVGGRVQVWDREKGRVRHELDHEGDVMVQAVACHDGPGGHHLLLSGTRQGKLLWWNISDE